MSVFLTYRHLGDAVQVGQPLGCDSTGWPYRVERVVHDVPADRTFVYVEPWPLLPPDASDLDRLLYLAATAHVRMRLAGVLS